MRKMHTGARLTLSSSCHSRCGDVVMMADAGVRLVFGCEMLLEDGDLK